MRHVRIAEAEEDDLPSLVDALGQEHYFATQLARQRDGHGVLLVALDRFTPVGDVYVWLAEAEEPELRDGLAGVPLLVHLEVAPRHRGRGIGTRLVLAAEEVVRRRCGRVALGVSPQDHRMHHFYQRLGYRAWRWEPVRTHRESWDEQGRLLREPDLCRVLIKDLPPRSVEGAL
ncbi:GNAT family N-acetyltransferase [Nonomuraea sp. NPDC050328]|uniref:GNAT family N-acetyltransferase n=1 Tax=Nonomuraea sp. NPDC050328 TaxID=3364361 RepID=UPI00378C2FFA